MLNRTDKTEMDIILSRAGYVLIGCAVVAISIVIMLIFKNK